MTHLTHRATRRRVAGFGLPGLLGLLALLGSGCVTYRAHLNVSPDGEVHVTERAQMLPGVAESLHIEPKFAWTAFEATTQGRGGQFKKDGLVSAEGSYVLDDWGDFGQRGQAFKGIDEIERRTRPANVGSEVKDQYFFRDTSLGYKAELQEPSGATFDSVAAPFMQQATGELVLTVPGQILETNATSRNGNTLTYPLRYGETVEVTVTYRQFEWVAMVSVVLVAIFLGYLAWNGLRAFQARKKLAKAA
ncbi:MAG: hypothetical protein ACREOU_09900 [Candidatus Eiseniibacteriota bacterium]